jgi:anti-sigma factor RsiW
MIPAGAAGALEAEEQRALDAHLLVCDECRREHDAFVETAALAALAIEPVAPPAAVRSRVLSAIDAAGAPASPNVARMRPRQTPAWWLAAAAVLIALGVGGWAWSVARQKQRNIDALRQQLLAAQRETIEGSQR